MPPRLRHADPPYVQIADEIRKDIVSGRLSLGDAVPSARQISATWGVALATATKVHALLRSEGLVEAQPGVGTVVAGRDVGFNASQRVARTRLSGRIYGPDERGEILSAVEVAATKAIADHLGILPGDKVIRRERLIRRRDEPVSSSVSWFRSDVVAAAPKLLETKRLRQGTFSYLEEATGVKIVSGREMETAAPATAEHAVRLGVEVGSPVLVALSWLLAEDGTVLEFGQSVNTAGRWSTHEFRVS
jgi:DNA-binding GntR family transcriptional regulator